MKIRTQLPRIPWSWALWMGLPWAGMKMFELVSNQPMTLSLSKYVEDPKTIGFFASVNILFNFSVGVFASYISDRIWTRFGRRRPFMIASLLGAGLTLLVVPLTGSFLTLAISFVAYQFFVDLAKSWEALFNEVIPPDQRGRAGTLRMLWVNLGTYLFLSVLVGQFEKTYTIDALPFTLNGELVLYGTLGLFSLGMAAFFICFVQETPPPSLEDPENFDLVPSKIPGVTWIRAKGEDNGVLVFLKDLFADRQARWVYLLYLCPWLTGIAASTESPNYTLFMTKQLGMPTESLGRIHAVTWPVMLLLFTPLAGFLADRLPRMLMFRVGMICPGLIQLGLFLYLRMTPDFSASVSVFVVSNLLTMFFQTWLWAVWGPLFFDYIPRERMGTTLAGITTVAGILGFAVMNAAGFWVDIWSDFFPVFPGVGEYDYSSMLILWFLLALICTGLTFLFSRAERQGKVLPVGREGLPESESVSDE